MRGRVGRLVQVDDTGANVRLEVALQWRAAIGNGGEVTSSDEDYCRLSKSKSQPLQFVGRKKIAIGESKDDQFQKEKASHQRNHREKKR